MLKNTMLVSLEKILNGYLRLDSEVSRLLQPLAGKTVTIETTLPPLVIHFFFEPSRIVILPTLEKPADATLKGSTFNLLKLYLKHPQARQDIEMHGDSTVIVLFANLFQQLDIDWEEHLSRWTGENFAYAAGKLLRNVLSCGTQIKETLTQNLTEYLHEECRLFPPREEMNDFLDDIDRLRDDVERLAAHIKLLGANI